MQPVRGSTDKGVDEGWQAEFEFDWALEHMWKERQDKVLILLKAHSTI